MGVFPRKLRDVLKSVLVRTPARELIVRRRASRYVTVLGFHRIHPPVGPNYPFNSKVFEATPEEFARFVRYLRRNFDLISMRQFVRGLQDPEQLPPRPGLITFDDGYWDNCDFAYPVLRDAGVPACFFLITKLVGTSEIPWPDQVACCFKFSRVDRFESPFRQDDAPYDTKEVHRSAATGRFLRNAQRVTQRRCRDILAWLREVTRVNPDEYLERPLMISWANVRKMLDGGMEFGGHTRTHPALAGIEDPEALRDEVAGCLEDIVHHTGATPEAFAYPFGVPATISPAAQEEVDRAGFQAAFSFTDTFASRPPRVQRFCIPRLRSRHCQGFAGFRLALAYGQTPEG